MPKKNSVEVTLPHIKPTVMLPNGLALTLQLIIDAGEQGINNLQLHEEVPMSGRGNVSLLRKYGAIIQTDRKVAHDSRGNPHKATAYYTYRGWN